MYILHEPPCTPSVGIMCTGKCSRVVGMGLWPLALICIVCNLLLFFPNWDTQYLWDKGSTLTPEVLYLGGLIGGGAMNLIPAIYIQATGRKGCCGNRCGMFLSIFFTLVGVAGAVYAVSISTLGLVHGPLCQLQHPNSSLTQWLQPFRSTDDDLSEQNYLFNTSMWDACVNPPGVVQFNVILFSLVLGTALLELLLCGVQVLNGFFGCLCGTCNKSQAGSPKQTAN